MQHCPNCGFDVEAPALARVDVMKVSWGGSPNPFLRGSYSDLKELESQGYAELTAHGWWIPTPKHHG